MLKLNFPNQATELSVCIEAASRHLNFEVGKGGIDVNTDYSQSLTVTIKNDYYFIGCSENAEFMRGLSLLVSEINKGTKNFSLIEKRSIKTCGVMVDMSRNAVMRVDAVKDYLERVALMGVNAFMLYTEDTYELDGYPYFGYMRGAYTKAELKEIDAYANHLGIEVIPCIQTLGHLATTLRWGYTRGMKENQNVLLVDEPKTYEFVEAMIKSTSECFRSRRIHIGFDEAHGVGLGAYLSKHGYHDKKDILIKHLHKVNDIVKKYGLEPIMWSDMFFRWSSKTGNYLDVCQYTKEDTIVDPAMSEKIPDGITQCYWDYYTEDEETYLDMIDGHKSLGDKLIFAGGVWTWRGMGVNYQKTFATTHTALKACRKRGVDEVFATVWGNEGSIVNVYSTLLGVQLFAEYCYNDEVSDELLAERFKACTGYDADAFLLLQTDNLDKNLYYGGPHNTVAVSKNILFQDVLTGLFDKNFESVNLKKIYKERAEALEKSNIPSDLKEMFDYQSKLLKMLSLKSDIGNCVTAAYKETDFAALKECLNDIKTLRSDLDELKKLALTWWYKNNKAFGFDGFDIRLGAIAYRLDTAILRLEAYISGKTDRLEELEAPRLYYNPTDNREVTDNEPLPRENDDRKIITVSV